VSGTQYKGAAMLSKKKSCLLFFFALVIAHPALAQDSDGRFERLKRLRQVMETQRENATNKVSQESLGAFSKNIIQDSYGGRDMLLYIPSHLPLEGTRSMLVALHGGGGNAQFMLDHLKIDGVAEKAGFIVAYLNGSKAARIGRDMKAWNAGKGCCGQPYENKVDDVGYITSAVSYLQQKYGVDATRTYGVGHSNGAMMTQTLMCVTNLYTKAVSLAGAMMAEVLTCPDAHGHTIYDYHGLEDMNVPLAGGYGTKGVSNINFTSAKDSKAFFEHSGGTYVQQIFKGADHSIEHINEVSQKQDGLTIGERIAHDLDLVP